MASVGTTTDYPVHLGFWTNWSHGRYTGATMTLSHRNGALLIAFLAIFVTTAGTSFWRIVCFAVHQLGSSRMPKDGLYHQRQAILRNAANEASGISALFRLYWAWRGRARDSLRRMLPLLCLNLIIMSIFAGAGILSSKLGQMGDEVLISSPACGLLDLSAPSLMNNTSIDTILDPYEERRMSYYADYAQSCYSDFSSRIGNCGPYVKSHISSLIEPNASCPFHTSMCRRNHGNIKIESTLDFTSDLGLNLPPQLQSSIRLVNSCAPLVTKGYTQDYKFSETETYTRFFYGPSGVGVSQSREYTYQCEQRSWDKFFFETFHGSTDYSIM